MMTSGRAVLTARRGRAKARWIGALILTGLMSLPAITAPLAHAGDSDVHFRHGSSYDVGSNPEGIATADLNGDTKLDLVEIDNNDNRFRVLFGNGDGTFQDAVVYCVGEADGLVDVTIGDFNKDTHPDLAITDTNTGNVYIYLNNGTGGFTAGTTVTSADPSCGLWGIVTADFDGDGNPDIAFADPDNNEIDVALGNGDGTFDAAVAYATSWYPEQLAVGDFDEDGNPDLAVTTNDGNVVSILLGNCNGVFTFHDDFAAGTNPFAIVAYDFNDDSHLDLVVTSEYGFVYLQGNGDGTFKDGDIHWSDNGDCGYYAMAMGDFNGDGKMDIAVSNGCDDCNYIDVFTGNDEGDFYYDSTYWTRGWTEEMVSGKFDSDSKDDLAFTNWDCDEVSTLLTTQPPSIDLTVGTPKETNDDTLYVTNATPLTLDITDEGDGAKAIFWRVYAVGSTPPAYSSYTGTEKVLSLVSLPEGNYQIDYYGTSTDDVAGCVETTYFTVQTTLPSAALTVGTPNATANGHQVVTDATPLTLTGTDTMSGITSVHYRIYLSTGSVPDYTDVEGDTTNPSLDSLPDGIYHVDFYSTNALGMDSPDGTTTLQIVSGLPATALTWTGTNITINTALYINGKSKINLNATGPVKVSSLSYRVYPSAGTPPSYTVVSGSKKSFTMGGKADGTYIIDYFATDVLGHTESMETLTFVLDQHAPVMSINANGTGQRTVTILAHDNASGVTTLYYRVYLKGSTAPSYDSVSGASEVLTITGAAGTYLVDYYSVDAVGNLSTVHRLTVKATGPAICISRPGIAHATC